MLYTASFFEPQNHHGQVYSIARSQPKGMSYPSIAFLAPSDALLKDWKAKAIDEQGYTDRYREELRSKWGAIDSWLKSLDPDQDLTLCCWEKTGFCHRNLVAKLVQKWRSELWGGSDLPSIAPENPPQQAEARSNDSPYPIGSCVRLKADPRFNYVVVSFEDLNETAHDQLKPGKTTWYYTLLSEKGDRAFWYHSHLVPS